MEKQILQEVRELKSILSRLIGTADRSVENPFSEAALNEAAKDFLKLSTDRGEWVKDGEIRRYVKTVPWNAGSFLRKEFAFANWYKRGSEYLYSKKDLIAFNTALEERKIDLTRYRELLESRTAFEKEIARMSKEKPYKIPDKLKNIGTSDIPKPDADLVRQGLARLKQEFRDGQYAAYIDVYKGLHAMLKNIYHFQKYLEPGLKRRCNKWCDDFNYANRALKMITGKKEKFNAPPDPTMIQL